MKKLLPIVLLVAAPFCGSAQKCANLNIQLKADIPSNCTQMPMTMMQDAQDRPYMYVAKKDGGFEVFDITDLTMPVSKKLIPASLMSDLHVMNVTQQGNYVYLALGNHFSSGQTPGMAIIDVSDPANAALTDVWVSSYTGGGCGIVVAEGNYAYVGAMEHGLLVMDVTDKGDIKFVSQFVPDINYPTPNPNPDLYNARGMEVRNGTVYLTYDAGGFRIISTSDKQNPSEIGKYSNPVMNGKPRAYNNIVLDDTIAYITVDYCGVEVFSITDPSNIKQLSWWNPWNCHTNPANWFSSPGHTNEVRIDKDNDLLFISSGKGDMHVVDIANPFALDSCSNYGGTLNGIGTWGVGLHKDRIFLSYICAVIPFASNWTGIKILTYDRPAGPNSIKAEKSYELKLYPVPAQDILVVETGDIFTSDFYKIRLINTLGQEQKINSQTNNKTLTLDVSALESGLYFVVLEGERKVVTAKFVK